MFNSEFSLNAVSQHPQFYNKYFKEYQIFGEDLPLIGVFGDEPYDLVFRNSSNQKVQVRLSIDGTDVATLRKAHTKPTSDGMWVVEPYGFLKLSAWVETDQKGRQFIFSSSGNEVAQMTHGDLSQQGIIAAAVFKDPIQNSIRKEFYEEYLQRKEKKFDPWKFNKEKYSMSLDSTEHGYCSDRSPLRSTPGTGAGQEIMQKISTVKGLINPCLATTLAIRYCWYDDLVNKLQNVLARPTCHPGFPGDEEIRYNDLSYIPVTGKVDKSSISRFV